MLFKNKLYGFLFFLLCTVASTSYASWLPTNADATFPRVMLQAADVSAAQARVNSAPYDALYDGIYTSATGTIPSATGNRRGHGKMAKNAAFVYLMGVDNNGVPLPDDSLRDKAINMLQTMDTSVVNAFAYTDWQWDSKSLIDYVIAYDLLRGAGVTDAQIGTGKTQVSSMATNLYTNANSTLFIFNFFRDIKNNHAIMTAGALSLAGIVLDDHPQAETWAKVGLWQIDDNFFTNANDAQSIRGSVGGYAEGPHYLVHGMQNVLPVLTAWRNVMPDAPVTATYNGTSRAIENPGFDIDYANLITWLTDIRLPDGKLPALEDTFTFDTFLEGAVLGNADDNYSITTKTLSSALQQNVDYRAFYIAAGTPMASAPLATQVTHPSAGSGVLRSSGTASDALYMHINAQSGAALTSGGGHNQADETAFLASYGGQVMALDSGYIHWDDRADVALANNHNLILVDG